MKRILSLTIASLFVGLILAGCTGGGGRDDDDGDGDGSAPDATATASTTAAEVGETISFNASQVGGNTATWSFGDGSNATGASVTHAYSTPGEYIVHLNVSDASGRSETNEANLIYVRISRPTEFGAQTPAPVASFTIDRQIIQPGGSVSVNASQSYAWVPNTRFNQTLGIVPGNLPYQRDCGGATACPWNASGPVNLTLSWDWGDGETSTTQEANHTYASSGVYTVTLTVKDANGTEGKRSATVLVLSQPPSVGGFKSKDLFVTATISGPQSFDPAKGYDTASGVVIQQVYETLFATERGNPNRIIPKLAASVPSEADGGITENGTRYVITLRRNVTFHDGTPFNAEAVKFSLDRLILNNDPTSGAVVVAPVLRGAEEYRKTHGNASDREAYLAQNAVEVIDEHTVAINLPAANPSFFQRMSFYAAGIVSPTAFKAAHPERASAWGSPSTDDGFTPATQGGGRVTRDPWADRNMVGTGPFKLRTWLPGDRTILDRNENYWGDAPALKTVILQYVDDLNTRVLMLRSGEADEIYVAPTDIGRVRPQVEGIARVTQTETTTVDAGFWSYDVQDPANCPRDAGGQPACQLFQDDKVREAITYAFDYQKNVRDVWQGNAFQLSGVIPKGFSGYDPAATKPTQDLERARAALAASNYSEGFSFDVYYNTGNTGRQGASELLKANLEALHPGIRVNVVGAPFQTILDKSQVGELPFYMLGWSMDYPSTENYVYDAFLHSRGTYPTSNQFSDPQLDALIEEALNETDPQEQARKYAAANKYAVDNYVFLFLNQRLQFHVERTYVQGYYYDPLLSGQPNIGDYSTVSKA